MKKSLSLGEKYYIHTTFLSIILFIIYTFGVNSSYFYSNVIDYKNINSSDFDGSVYPIEYIANPLILSYEERQKEYSEIDSKYYIPIPEYNGLNLGQDITKFAIGSDEYNKIMLQRFVYSTPYMGDYKGDYKEYVGSHIGVDIVAPPGTPVYSIANGLVVDVGFSTSGFGNFVLIKHNNVPLPNGKNGIIYSLYAHLSSIEVKMGEKIGKKHLIGKVGKTGLAIGNHLHFQIELEEAPYHPYWPFNNKDLKEANLDFFSRVNAGLGKENGLLYTINPLEFINKYKIFLASSNNLSNEENEKKQNISQENVSNIEKKEDIILVNNKNENSILKEEIKKDDVELLSTIKIDDFENVNLLTLDDNKNENIKEENKEIKHLDLVGLTEKVLEENSKIDTNNQNLEKKIDYPSGEYLTGKIFNDIDSNYKYIEELKYFLGKNIISGYEDNTFRPYNKLSRIETLKILLLSFDKKTINDQKSNFNDIKTLSWQNTYTNRGLYLGIITKDNNNFYPNREISRIEFLKMLLTLSGKDISLLDKKDINLKDVSINDWSYKYVKFAYYNNLFDDIKNYFFPNKSISREEAIKIIYYILKK